MNVLSIIGRQEAELRYQLIIHITSTAGQNCVSSVIVDCASAMTTSRSFSLSTEKRINKFFFPLPLRLLGNCVTFTAYQVSSRYSPLIYILHNR